QPMSIQSDLLPVQVAVLEYYKNSDVEAVKPGEKNIATAGRGLKEKLVSLPAAKGTDTGGAVDYAGAYVQLTSPDGKDLGTYMVSQLASLQLHPERFAEKVTVGGKEYLMFLRFKRAYLPFTVSLIDVRKDDYIASNTPRNYSSDIRLNDPAAGVDQSVHIKMNDPLRYRSMTIYQSGYDRTERGEITALQVVYNRIWMIPYVACAIVGIGMVAHFLITVTRFVVRRENEERADAGAIDLEFAPQPTLGAAKGSQLQPQLANSRGKQFNWSLVGLPVLAASLFLAMVAAASRTTEAPPDELDLARFGRLPVADEGRLKPFDSLARTSLTTISNRDYVKLEDGTKLSAIEWLLDVITGKLDVTTGKEASQNYRVIRIEHPDLLKLFELEERPGSLRYSVKEIQPQMDRFLAQLAPAEELGRKDASKLTVTQKKLLQLNERLKEYVSLVQSFSNPRLPDLPTQQEFEQTPEVANQKIDALRLAIFQSGEAMKQINAPRPIPLDMPDGTTQEEHWHAFPNAVIMSFLKTNVMGEDADPVTVSFSKILAAYQEQDATIFNRELARYESLVAKQQPPLLVPGKIASEAEFNRIKPFSLGMYAYLAAFMLGIFGWLLRWKPLNWTSFTLILLAFLLHTAALVARIYISGRPPVTNLYSSAVFIGWAVVIFGLLIEGIFRLGLGNIVAAVAGYATLLIASYLALDGDTIAVLQAVLDTQFWLATHVVCITLGYAATYAAGLLGILYVVFGMATPLLDSRSRKDLGRMIYGITCFAILFSFVGTVLGGLWADDSWGRFWGWDPKENGALIIVLWNALVLHARWDKMIGDRGLAVLAVGGNIVTSWSWFGVNQLGIGLHSYGFTSGVALALTAFVGSQLLLIVVGSLPKSLWWSFSAERAA
ncbi:MAG: cytochrome c biogenesis protein CcsA, partial [Pirellulaceae bacterium]